MYQLISSSIINNYNYVHKLRHEDVCINMHLKKYPITFTLITVLSYCHFPFWIHFDFSNLNKRNAKKKNPMNRSVTRCQCRQLSCASTSTECDNLYKSITIYWCLFINFFIRGTWIYKEAQRIFLYLYVQRSCINTWQRTEMMSLICQIIRMCELKYIRSFITELFI
jgi:hypothetical protein